MKKIFCLFAIILLFSPMVAMAAETAGSGTGGQVTIATAGYVETAKSKVRDGQNGTTYFDMWVE
ncbi:MAG: hypothetical protein ACLRFI_01275 [Alphaproteobacteria bacterium]